jgi:hypothetical protein
VGRNRQTSGKETIDGLRSGERLVGRGVRGVDRAVHGAAIAGRAVLCETVCRAVGSGAPVLPALGCSALNKAGSTRAGRRPPACRLSTGCRCCPAGRSFAPNRQPAGGSGAFPGAAGSPPAHASGVTAFSRRCSGREVPKQGVWGLAVFRIERPRSRLAARQLGILATPGGGAAKSSSRSAAELAADDTRAAVRSLLPVAGQLGPLAAAGDPTRAGSAGGSRCQGCEGCRPGPPGPCRGLRHRLRWPAGLPVEGAPLSKQGRR